jgi:hypothetical protein
MATYSPFPNESLPNSSLMLVRNLLNTMFERIETKGGTISAMIPRAWFRDFYADIGVLRYPQGNSNPCRHLERVVS